MDKLIQTLQEINWNFSDYNSSKYPLDINSIPWYPATFIPPIPKFLIGLLTKPGDIVFDPFGGKGTTAVEALKQNRIPISNDLNPFASEIVNAIFYSVDFCLKSDCFMSDEATRLKGHEISANLLHSFVIEHNINADVFDWYDSETLAELLSIMSLMFQELADDDKLFYVRKLALSSIFKAASSQPGHFTYVTDNCKPSKLVYKNAKQLYLNKVQQITLAAKDFIKQFSITNPSVSIANILQKVKVVTGDARKLNWIDDRSVNLVLTSPPYLCAQDYIKTMRLTNLFFQNKAGFEEAYKDEIGPRSKRRSKPDIVVPKFYSDMNMVFSNIKRVLVPGGYFCLVIGQGKAKITESYDTISDLCHDIQDKHGLEKIHHATRKISNRVIQVGGVSKEDIIIFQNSN